MVQTNGLGLGEVRGEAELTNRDAATSVQSVAIMKSTEYEEHRMQVTLTVKRLLDCPLDGRSLYVKLKWGSRALWGGKENYTSTKPSQKRTIEWEETFDHECTVFLDTVVLGLKWKDAGSQKPANAIEIRNADLASALQSKLTFTKQELKSFGVPAVTFDSHIKVGDKYFKPAEVAKEEGHLRRQQTSLAHLRLSVRKEKNGQNPIKARKRKLGNIDIPLVDWAVLYGNGKEHNVRYLLDGTYSTALLEVAVKIKWPDGEPLRQDGALYHSISGGVFEDSKEESHANTPLPKLEMGNSNPGKEEQDEEEKLAGDVWREYSHFQNYSADHGADTWCQDPVQVYAVYVRVCACLCTYYACVYTYQRITRVCTRTNAYAHTDTK